jgi:hypothetical protein
VKETTLSDRRATYVDYQARASVFSPGDRVFPMLGGNPAAGGTVIAVWPAIGMVDVQFGYGATRYPVEDLVIDQSDTFENFADFQADSIPGGTPTVSVSGGPDTLAKDVREDLTNDELYRDASSDRVVEAFVKKALYWDSPDRKYRMNRGEMESGTPTCPRCDGVELAKVIYKREDGKNEKLYCCRDCLFMIRRGDIIGAEGA